MFKELSGAREALDCILQLCPPLSRTEELPLAKGAGRVLAEDICSPVDLPSFNRAAMDGFAVRAADTRGASLTAPVYLDLGREAIPVRTGMEVPAGMDAVVMMEDAVRREREVEIMAPLYPWRNVSRVGEDISRNQTVLAAGRRLRPPDLALMAALGWRDVRVYDRPRVAIIPTGSELVSLDGPESPGPGQAYEINGLMASLYVQQWGGRPARRGIVPDEKELIKETIRETIRGTMGPGQAGREADLILLIGGTSVGEKDYAPRAVSEMGRLLVHGLRITPGKPTAIGLAGETPVVCLPGYPVAALAALYLLVRPALKKMARLDDRLKTVSATLAGKIVSRPGYLTLARVSLKGDLAEPIMTSGAGRLSSVARAEGIVVVPEESEGMEAGERVEVMLIE
ncbi:MAG: molybdopterin molybdotransferase MoeA [Methanosarcinales archaeon]|nr:molybdopterin molybdotransferase MoeA [Methanosarcinales archaeon]